jgi:L-ornithine N5-oxygenase
MLNSAEVSSSTAPAEYCDVAGVGFGPANIALAILMEEVGFPGKATFLEKHIQSSWQPEMLLPGSDIQNNPGRDLVTPRNPRSRYTFMNFLFEHNRLFEHLNLGLPFPLRREFAEYVVWVANFFSAQVAYGNQVERLSLSREAPGCYALETSQGRVVQARSVVLAPGRTPLIPEVFRQADRQQVFHLTAYQRSISELAARRPLRRVVVVGGSQSAVEIILHLRASHPETEVINIQRGYGFRLKDTSPFSEHVYFPEFVDYYYDGSPETKQRLNKHLHYTNYSSADADVIHQLYVSMYEDKLAGKTRVTIINNSDITACEQHGDYYRLGLEETNLQQAQWLEGVDGVILATGFRNFGAGEQDERCPAILNEIYPLLQTHENGVIKIGRDYRLLPKAGVDLPPLYLNGLCESSHGYGDAGSFSLLSLRAKEIWQSLAAQLQPENACS